MKRLELIDKGNNNTLLTVTKDRITIKFKTGLDSREKDRITNFLRKVASELENEPHSMRGALQTGYWIQMKSDSGLVRNIFRENEIYHV
jgi:hypothetical protein